MMNMLSLHFKILNDVAPFRLQDEKNNPDSFPFPIIFLKNFMFKYSAKLIKP